MQNYSVTEKASGRILFQAPLEATAAILHLNPKQVEDLIHSTIVLDQHWEYTMPSDSAVWPGKAIYIHRLPIEISILDYPRNNVHISLARRQAE